MFDVSDRADRNGISRRALVSGAASLGILPLLTSPARASWPPRTVRIVVPFGPGGVPDLAARLIADSLARTLSTTVVVENKPGSGGTNGVVGVVRSEPDGSTLIVCTSAFILNKVLNPNLPYEPTTSLTPICEIADAPNVFVARSSLGVGTLSEFISLARSRPEGISYSSPGLGTTPQVSAELLGARAGIKLVHVPYNIAPQAVQDLLSGVVQSSCFAIPLLKPHIESGALKALAVTSPKRWRELPDVPTMGEAGFERFETDTLLMLAGPASLSPEIVKSLTEATQSALNTPVIKEKLEASGLAVLARGPTELAGRLSRDEVMWKDIVQSIASAPK